MSDSRFTLGFAGGLLMLAGAVSLYYQLSQSGGSCDDPAVVKSSNNIYRSANAHSLFSLVLGGLLFWGCAVNPKIGDAVERTLRKPFLWISSARHSSNNVGESQGLVNGGDANGSEYGTSPA